MHLLPDPLFTLPTDSSYLMQTIGTANGRIFTGGKDGCLYEVEYQVKEQFLVKLYCGETGLVNNSFLLSNVGQYY